jgi:hypothetical protein
MEDPKMGWDYTHATHYTSKGTVDRKAEVDTLYNWKEEGYKKVEVVKSVMVGRVYYAAIKVTHYKTGIEEIKAAVVLTAIDSRRGYFDIGMKTMDETMGPCEATCPASILNLLTPTDDEWAIEWRNRCRANIEKKKSPTALKNLPVGSVIQFEHYGETIELYKHPAAGQFKRPFWYCESKNGYISANRIPDNYKVVTA